MPRAHGTTAVRGADGRIAPARWQTSRGPRGNVLTAPPRAAPVRATTPARIAVPRGPAVPSVPTIADTAASGASGGTTLAGAAMTVGVMTTVVAARAEGPVRIAGAARTVHGRSAIGRTSGRARTVRGAMTGPAATIARTPPTGLAVTTAPVGMIARAGMTGRGPRTALAVTTGRAGRTARAGMTGSGAMIARTRLTGLAGMPVPVGMTVRTPPIVLDATTAARAVPDRRRAPIVRSSPASRTASPVASSTRTCAQSCRA